MLCAKIGCYIFIIITSCISVGFNKGTDHYNISSSNSFATCKVCSTIDIAHIVVELGRI